MKLPRKAGVLAIALAAGLSVMSCKSKSSNAANNDTTATPVNPQPDNTTVKPDTMQAPRISSDDSLTMKAKDSVKDYPGVTATVSSGEVTLTGDITRDKLPKLLQAVNAMHPKKVNNKLTIK